MFAATLDNESVYVYLYPTTRKYTPSLLVHFAANLGDNIRRNGAPGLQIAKETIIDTLVRVFLQCALLTFAGGPLCDTKLDLGSI
jgi:hypothetical protein